MTYRMSDVYTSWKARVWVADWDFNIKYSTSQVIGDSATS